MREAAMYRDHDAEASFWADQQAPPGVPSSETKVKRGDRVVGVDTELVEKLGGNDPCPCGSGRRFQALLPRRRPLRRHQRPLLRPRLTATASPWG
jgi:hypothetical protein